jgi:hypothetical protein
MKSSDVPLGIFVNYDCTNMPPNEVLRCSSWYFCKLWLHQHATQWCCDCVCKKTTVNTMFLAHQRVCIKFNITATIPRHFAKIRHEIMPNDMWKVIKKLPRIQRHSKGENTAWFQLKNNRFNHTFFYRVMYVNIHAIIVNQRWKQLILLQCTFDRTTYIM